MTAMANQGSEMVISVDPLEGSAGQWSRALAFVMRDLNTIWSDKSRDSVQKHH